MAKAKGGGKLHRLPFRPFGEIAALGFEIEVRCSSCYRQTKVDPADRRLNDRIFASAPFRCGGMRDHGFAVPLQPCRDPDPHTGVVERLYACVDLAAVEPLQDALVTGSTAGIP
jgi:hypothetical protein